MKSKIHPQKIKDALQKIEESNVFTGSERNIKILRFLVNAYLEEIHVKESVLEIELFGEGNSAVSYDGKVRVYMFNLRKKLEEYYRTEGASDKLIFTIKKGQYNLSAGQRITEQKKKLQVPAYALFVLAIVIVLAISNKQAFAPTYCWKPFFKHNAPTTCCVGDHFMMVGIDQNNTRIVSYYGNVNTDKDYEDFLTTETAEKSNYTKAPFSFVTKMGPVATARLASWFTKHNAGISVIMETEMSVEETSHSNIVYVGPYRTMDVLSSLFLKDSKVFYYDGRQILNAPDKQKINIEYSKEPTTSHSTRVDPVMVSFNRLTDTGQNILFFAGNNDIGVQAVVKNFTNRKWLKTFYKKLPGKDARFNALFVVKGIGRTDLACELLQLEVLAE